MGSNGLKELSVPHLGHLISSLPVTAFLSAFASNLRHEPHLISFMRDNLMAFRP
jgi:hypothetical protein